VPGIRIPPVAPFLRKSEMTEDDTFNRLKRVDFDVALSLSLNQMTKFDGDISTVFNDWETNYSRQTGWTFGELLDEFSLRSQVRA
jgi:hypothetical protein